VTINLPKDADLATCIDSCLKEVCDAITQRRDLPDDIRSMLCGAAATLAVALASLPLHKDQRRAPTKKCRARCRKVAPRKGNA
jgi:hypothetical protein